MSEDAGESWWLVAGPTFPGAVYGIAYVPGARTLTLVAVGPGGASYSIDNGKHLGLDLGRQLLEPRVHSLGHGLSRRPDGRLTRLDLTF